MKILNKLFLDHPHAVGETYFEHQRHAAAFGVSMIGGGLACLIHSVFPRCFEFTAARIIASLHNRVILHRGKDGSASPFLAQAKAGGDRAAR